MKRVYIAAVLFLLLMIGCTLSTRYMRSTTQQLTEQASAIESAIRNGESRAVSSQRLQELLQSWESKRPFLIAIAGRTSCEPIETVISSLPVRYEDNDYGELMAALSQLSAHISELWELQAPMLINLF